MKLPKIDLEKTKLKIESFIKEKVGDKKAVLGLSGGIDSSVVLKLCEEALGKENVIGVMLPVKCNKEDDLRDAINYAEKLGVEYHVKNIDEIVETFFNEFDFLKDKISRGNVMARIRMTSLYSYANEYMGLVIGTSNKTELMIGYITKYGDGGVDIEPIGDLYKTYVRELAKYIGVPEKIISKPPSAGLWEGQTDEGELGIDYETLDKILYSLENNLDTKHFSKEKVNKVREMISSNIHKRKLPPSGGVVYVER